MWTSQDVSSRRKYRQGQRRPRQPTSQEHKSYLVLVSGQLIGETSLEVVLWNKTFKTDKRSTHLSPLRVFSCIGGLEAECRNANILLLALPRANSPRKRATQSRNLSSGIRHRNIRVTAPECLREVAICLLKNKKLLETTPLFNSYC